MSNILAIKFGTAEAQRLNCASSFFFITELKIYYLSLSIYSITLITAAGRPALLPTPDAVKWRKLAYWKPYVLIKTRGVGPEIFIEGGRGREGVKNHFLANPPSHTYYTRS